MDYGIRVWVWIEVEIEVGVAIALDSNTAECAKGKQGMEKRGFSNMGSGCPADHSLRMFFCRPTADPEVFQPWIPTRCNFNCKIFMNYGEAGVELKSKVEVDVEVEIKVEV